MAEKVQITPMVTPDTRDLLRRTCQEKGCSQGDLVEQALLALLCPSDEGAILPRLAEQQAQLADNQRHMQAILERLLSAFDALQPVEAPTAPAETPPIATYEQIYGPIEAAAPVVTETPVSQPQPARARRLRRWFLREGSA